MSASAVASVRLAAAILAALLAGTLPAAGADARGPSGRDKAQFVTFELASTPPAAPGTLCPGSADCWNNAVEPAIRADPSGTFYAASENTLFKGTIAAKSEDGGLHYASLPSPNIFSAAGTQFAPGGGDVDVATAPLKNAAGFYNVYVASLSLADVTVSTSSDGGVSWSINPTAAQIAGDDREWIAADGERKVCISYHDLATFNVDVDCSYDAGLTFVQHAVPGAIDAAHAFLLENNQLGNLAIDPRNDTIYQPLVGIASPLEALCGTTTDCRYHAIWMAVSTDGGLTFTDYPVYINPSAQVGYNHQFPNVAIDRAGNVYVVFSDDHAVYYSVSSDRGRTWTAPVVISTPPATTAIFPWATAGDPGKLDVVYYGSTYADGATPPDSFPAAADWYVYLAQSRDAARPRSTFTQVRVTSVVHHGGVCETGISCSGNRDLFDDFGVAASPSTGFASIAYTSDQYVPQPGCTPEWTNTLRCDHTEIATQTAGLRIFGRGDRDR
jgi:hypothetical protein